MGCWDWNDVPSQTGSMAGAPPAAKLAASIVPGPKLDAEYEADVAIKTGLPQLSLIEWSISDEVPQLFELLRMSGSTCGYVVNQIEQFRPASTFRKIELTTEIAEAIASDSAMDMPMAFVDERCVCALVSFHSDYALMCLEPNLFGKWLKANPKDLTMWAGEEPWPLADNLPFAQELARKRLISWNEYIRQSRSIAPS